ncbi:MAG: hypothetical protein MUF49_17805 [Oculatellaceae cyanobacterium Prado106]|nr:hypothetical protein [Oculatellaceae cyanobacterium Prado106]
MQHSVQRLAIHGLKAKHLLTLLLQDVLPLPPLPLAPRETKLYLPLFNLL